MLGAGFVGTNTSACCTAEVDCETCGAAQRVFVVDATTKEAITDARVAVDGKTAECILSDFSAHQCKVPLGAHIIGANAPGYASHDVTVTGKRMCARERQV